jgi:hypothetical protein
MGKPDVARVVEVMDQGEGMKDIGARMVEVVLGRATELVRAKLQKNPELALSIIESRGEFELLTNGADPVVERFPVVTARPPAGKKTRRSGPHMPPDHYPNLALDCLEDKGFFTIGSLVAWIHQTTMNHATESAAYHKIIKLVNQGVLSVDKTAKEHVYRLAPSSPAKPLPGGPGAAVHRKG